MNNHKIVVYLEAEGAHHQITSIPLKDLQELGPESRLCLYVDQLTGELYDDPATYTAAQRQFTSMWQNAQVTTKEQDEACLAHIQRLIKQYVKIVDDTHSYSGDWNELCCNGYPFGMDVQDMHLALEYWEESTARQVRLNEWLRELPQNNFRTICHELRLCDADHPDLLPRVTDVLSKICDVYSISPEHLHDYWCEKYNTWRSAMCGA